MESLAVFINTLSNAAKIQKFPPIPPQNPLVKKKLVTLGHTSYAVSII